MTEVPLREAISALIWAGDQDGISSELAGTAGGVRASLMPGIRALRERFRVRGAGHAQRAAAWVAGAACLTDADAAARWLTAPDLETPIASAAAVLRLLRDRAAPWQSEVALLVARRQPQRIVARPSWRVAYGLTVFSGGPVPDADGFVRGWVAESTVPADADVRVLLSREDRSEWDGRTLTERLRHDPCLDQLVPRLFQVDGLGYRLQNSTDAASRGGEWWAAALATLAGEGRIGRGVLIDGCLSRLVRGERAAHVRGFMDVYAALVPTARELSERTPDYVRLLLREESAVAKFAQRELRRVDEDGLLSPGVPLEPSSVVLRRPERALVRGQLAWLDGHAARYPDQAGKVVTVAAVALLHEALTVQERATALIAKHAAAAGEETLGEIRSLVLGLDIDLRALILPALGVADAPPAEPADVVPGPPPYRPAPMPDPLGSPAEVAEEFVQAQGDGIDSPRFERLLSTVVALAFSDRSALREALSRQVVRRPPRTPSAFLPYWYPLKPALLQLASVVGGGHAPHFLRVWGHSRDHRITPNGVPIARVWELSSRLDRFPVPTLLATPTESNGLLDPLVLVDRMLRYEAAGRHPWPADFEQALARLPAVVDHEASVAARRLASPAGVKLAGLLAGTGRPVWADTPGTWHIHVVEKQARLYGGSWVELLLLRARWRRRLEAARADLLACLLLDSPASHVPRTTLWEFDAPDHWSAVVPSDPEFVAAHALPVLEILAQGLAKGTARALPPLAGSVGVFGPATHTALAYGLAARDAKDREAAVAAVCILSSRALLDPAELGRQLGTMLTRREFLLVRIHSSLREAAYGGAHRDVWEALTVLLPHVLVSDPWGQTSGKTADLLVVATECAKRAGARGSFPELDALAARGGMARVVLEARRLRRTLTG